MKVRWTRRALKEVEQLGDYIAKDNPHMAEVIVSLIFRRSDDLADFPRAGRAGRVPGTFELILPETSHILVYRVTEWIEVLAVLHMARKWPKTL